jgi:protein involved in polysaccharide export with SLBB domain
MPKGVADVALRGEVSRNVFLRDGDLVYIPDNVAKKVFVLGEVQRPDAVQIERNAVSLAEVLAVCGGPTPARARRELAIIRGGFDKPTVYIVDLEKQLLHPPARAARGRPRSRGPTGLSTTSRTMQQFLPRVWPIDEGGWLLLECKPLRELSRSRAHRSAAPEGRIA